MAYKISRTDYTHLIQLIKKGSYELCCKYVAEKHLDPIQGVHSLKCLIIGVQYLKEEFSAEYFFKLINYLNIEEDVKLGDLKNYLLSMCHIVQFFLKKEELQYVSAILQQLKPFHKTVQKDENEIYFHICQMCIKHYKTNQQYVTSATFAAFLDWFISLQETFNADGVLGSLLQLTTMFTKSNHCPQVGVAVIDALIRSQCQIFTRHSFKELLNILRNTFITEFTKSSEHLELILCIQKLKEYMMSNLKVNGLYEVMEYFDATTKLYLTVDLLQLDDPDLFMEPIAKLNTAYGKSSAASYLEDVVAFSVHMQAAIKVADRQLIEKVGPIKFTKALSKSLHAYISHAKSQAIILKRSELKQKCCCSVPTNIVSAITSQVDAFSYLTRLLSRIKDDSSINAEIYMSLHKLVSNCMELMEALKVAGCQKVAGAWDHFSRNVYSLCQRLAAAKRKNVNLMFLEALAKGCFRYSENSHIYNEKCTASIFYYLADCLVAFKRWNDAMDVCALSMRMHKSNRKPISNIWNTIMYNCKGQETIADVFGRKSVYLQSLCDYGEVVQSEEMAELHKCEVRNYLERFQKWTLVEKSLDLLADLVNTEEYIAFLMTLPLDVIHYCTFSVFIAKHSIPSNADALHAAIFKFILYKHHLRVARANFKKLPKMEKIQDEESEIENVDPEHASNYSHIAITVHESFIMPLKEALVDLCKVRDAKGELGAMVLDLIIQIGHEFELHCYESNARTAWSLAANVAERMKAFGKQVHIATFAFKYLKGSQAEFTLLLNACQQIIDTNEIDIYTKFTFYTELATFYLNTDQLAEFRQAYHVAHAMFYEFGGTLYRDDKSERNIERDLANAHFALMIGAMEMLRCQDVVDEMHGCQTFQMPINTWHLLLPRMHNASCPKQAQLFTAFFNLGEHIVWKYYWSRMPREAQQIARGLVTFAENAICTFRVCRQLAVMGKLKMQALEVETCQEYINDFDRILGVDKMDSEDVGELSRDFERGLLIRDTSPVVLKRFRAPGFLRHEDCACTPCTSKDYQCALIAKYHLECIVADHYKDYKMVVNLLDGCFSVYQQCKRKYGFHSAEIYAGLLMMSIKICRQLEDMDRFRTNVNTLCSLFEKYQYKNYYLYNEVNTLQLMILVESSRKKTRILPLPENVEDNKKEDICKTPEYDSRHSQTPCSIIGSKLSANTLEVPVPIGPRTRIRGKRNLIAELQDTKSCEEQASTATTKGDSKIPINRKKTTRSNPRKTMR